MKTARLFSILFAFVCFLTFSEKALECITRFLEYETVTHSSKERRELHLMPQICLTTPELGQQRLQQLGIEQDNYTQRGVWVNRANNSWNEDQVLQRTLTEPSDFGNDTLLKIYKRIALNKDQYVKDTLTYKDVINGSKIILTSLDYYDYVGGILCFDLADGAFPYGIERLYVYTPHDLIFFIISPGNFFSSERKKNVLYTDKSSTYRYQVLNFLFQCYCRGVPLGVKGPAPGPQPLLQRHRRGGGRLQTSSHQCTMS